MKARITLLGIILLAGAVFAPAQVLNNRLASGYDIGEGDDDDAYDQGKAALNDGRWELAVEKFSEAAREEDSRSAGALYWKAYALNKLGRRGEAFDAVSELRKTYPKSKWVKDADALCVEMGGCKLTPTAAGPANCGGDEETKLLILDRMMDQEDERAVDILEKFLNCTNSKKLQDHALFVLSQSDSPRARAVVEKIARGQNHPELQRRAIEKLGIEGGQHNLDVMFEIYKSSSDGGLKRALLNSLGVADDKKHLLEIANGEKDPKLLHAAINGLGVAGARNELRQLYKQSDSADAKKAVMDAMIVDGDTEGFAEIARTEKNVELQKKAIQGLGVNGATAELRRMYKDATSKEIKKSVLQAFIVDGDTGAFAEVARTESDPELRKQAIEGLGVNGATAELRQLYKESNSKGAKLAVLNAFIVAGDSEAFMDIAKNEPDPELRHKAIEGIGISGGKGAGAALVAVYQNYSDKETKHAALNGLFIADDARHLIELAKKETDPEMKRVIIEKLSVMGNKEAKDYLIEILEK